MGRAVSSQYDSFADQYKKTKESPLRTYVEAHSFWEMVGDVSGLSVLDLACGEGHYTRLLKQRGAARVVGVDISQGMIDLALSQEQDKALGVEYLCRDVASMENLGEFDLVVAAYLLHYAPDEQSLLNMCRNIVAHMPDSGRFVTLNENPEQPEDAYAGYDQYGFNKSAKKPRSEGSVITYWMISGREVFKFEAYYHSSDTYQRTFQQAGFSRWEWKPLEVSDQGIQEMGTEYFQEYLNNPPIKGLICHK